jgi:hypothetical protein
MKLHFLQPPIAIFPLMFLLIASFPLMILLICELSTHYLLKFVSATSSNSLSRLMPNTGLSLALLVVRVGKDYLGRVLIRG